MNHPQKNESGIVLIVVLWIVTLLSFALYGALFASRTEYSLSVTYEDEEKLHQIALSGIEYGVAILMEDTTPYDTLEDPWVEDESLFREHEIGEGSFSLIRPKPDGSAGIAYGILDEESLLNVNQADPVHLAALKPFDEAMAQAIVDWRDEDTEEHPEGAEDGYYLSLNPAYRAKNAPFETLMELLYVKDITPAVLFGRDRNRNYKVDSSEAEDPEAETDFGAWPLLTAWSEVPNLDLASRKRVNVNKDPEEQVRAVLSGSWSEQQIQQLLSFRRSDEFQSVAQLTGLPNTNKAEVQPVYDRLTVTDNERLPGRVNVNTAPREVLRAIGTLSRKAAEDWPEGILPPENLSDEDIERILQARQGGGENLASAGWLLNVLSEPKFRALGPWITTRSRTFRIDVVARLKDKPLFKRYIAVVRIDREARKARILYFTDASDRFIRPE